MAALILSRLGFVAANTNRGGKYPEYTVPKIMAQTREGKNEAVDARQLVRGAFISHLDERTR